MTGKHIRTIGMVLACIGIVGLFVPFVFEANAEHFHRETLTRIMVAGIFSLVFLGLGGIALHEHVAPWWDVRQAKADFLMHFASNETYDLTLLSYIGIVAVAATGKSITEVTMACRNTSDMQLSVRVRPGVVFVAKGNYQNMAATGMLVFAPPRFETVESTVAVVCINAGLPIPNEQNRFEGVVQAPDDVARFIAAIGSSAPMAAQAGVWAITDNCNSGDLRQRLIARHDDGTTGPAIRDADIAYAASVLRALSIVTPISPTS